MVAGKRATEDLGDTDMLQQSEGNIIEVTRTGRRRFTQNNATSMAFQGLFDASDNHNDA